MPAIENPVGGSMRSRPKDTAGPVRDLSRAIATIFLKAASVLAEEGLYLVGKVSRDTGVDDRTTGLPMEDGPSRPHLGSDHFHQDYNEPA